MKGSLDKEVLKLFRRCEVFNDTLILPDDRIPSEVKDALIEVVASLGGEWRVSKRLFEFKSDPSEAVGEIKDTGIMPLRSPLGYYDTPTRLVNRMLDLVPPSAKVFLEPSVGDGVIAKLIKKRFPGSTVDCVDSDPIRCGKIRRGKEFIIVHGDFLAQKMRAKYDAVVMSPPFMSVRDPFEYAAHVKRAFELLLDGGTLVSTAPASFFHSNEKRIVDLRDFVNSDAVTGTVERLKAETFRVADFDVGAVLLHVVKKAKAQAAPVTAPPIEEPIIPKTYQTQTIVF